MSRFYLNWNGLKTKEMCAQLTSWIILLLILMKLHMNTRNMQHVCNPQCLLRSLNVPLKLTKQWILLNTSRSSLSGRVLTLERLQQVANSPKQHWLYWLWWCRWSWARGYGTSPQHPAQYVLSCSDVSRGPANHSVCGAPCCELANQSARTQVAFVRGVWDDAVEAPPMHGS